eukprot:CAMPEP_0181200226 /NCGR_PEP_ID=MMETSP1096-20121128/17640_1 /TAXON_ID=156174 ORGANISM="Chrysochromulina ericina, Strain CCMP281" /NCGR_SAMPLE_ID=MMETSP1096 /ASSEMBLY_ACC=CAM_ASM_000453 /LENGTH=68 /DNA_ID=CAMNT_0023290547 /DNA_START=761 /DNA_END=963 /DNA_ORIENTATION=-
MSSHRPVASDTTYSSHSKRIPALEGSAGKCGIVILHFEKLQKAPDTSQEFMNTMQCSIVSGSMSIHTS